MGAKKFFGSCFACYHVDEDGVHREGGVKRRVYSIRSRKDSERRSQREYKKDLSCSGPIPTKTSEQLRISFCKDSPIPTAPANPTPRTEEDPSEDGAAAAVLNKKQLNNKENDRSFNKVTFAEGTHPGTPAKGARHSTSALPVEALTRMEGLDYDGKDDFKPTHPTRERAVSCHPVLMGKLSYFSTYEGEESDNENENENVEETGSLSASDME